MQFLFQACACLLCLPLLRDHLLECILGLYCVKGVVDIKKRLLRLNFLAERLPDGLAGATPYIRDQEDFSVASREFPPPSTARTLPTFSLEANLMGRILS